MKATSSGPEIRDKSSALADSDPVVLILTIGFILFFVGASIVNSASVASVIGVLALNPLHV